MPLTPLDQQRPRKPTPTPQQHPASSSSAPGIQTDAPTTAAQGVQSKVGNQAMNAVLGGDAMGGYGDAVAEVMTTSAMGMQPEGQAGILDMNSAMQAALRRYLDAEAVDVRPRDFVSTATDWLLERYGPDRPDALDASARQANGESPEPGSPEALMQIVGEILDLSSENEDQQRDQEQNQNQNQNQNQESQSRPSNPNNRESDEGTSGSAQDTTTPGMMSPEQKEELLVQAGVSTFDALFSEARDAFTEQLLDDLDEEGEGEEEEEGEGKEESAESSEEEATPGESASSAASGEATSPADRHPDAPGLSTLLQGRLSVYAEERATFEPWGDELLAPEGGQQPQRAEDSEDTAPESPVLDQQSLGDTGQTEETNAFAEQTEAARQETPNVSGMLLEDEAAAEGPDAWWGRPSEVERGESAGEVEDAWAEEGEAPSSAEGHLNEQSSFDQSLDILFGLCATMISAASTSGT